MVGRDGVTDNFEPLKTREGFALLSSQPSYPVHCDVDIPDSPEWVVSSNITALVEPFWGYLPTACDSSCTRGCALRADNDRPGLGPALVRAYVRGSLAKGRSVIVVPAAVGGKSIRQFDPAEPTAQLWARMKAATLAALAYRPPGAGRALDNRVAGLFWLQGEADSYPSPGKPCRDYFAALTRVVEGVRGLAGGEQVPFVAGQLLQHWFSGFTVRACAQTALMRLATVPGGLANAALVSSAGLVSIAYSQPDTLANAARGTKSGEHYHFGQRSLRMYGRRFYAAFKSLAPVGDGGAGDAAVVAAAAPTPSPTPRPVHACHWARSGAFLQSAEWERDDSRQLHLLLRGVDATEQWAVGAAALFYEVKLAQWDAAAAAAAGLLRPARGASAALAAGLPVRSTAHADDSCDACSARSSAQLLAAEDGDGYVAVPAACGGYAFVDRDGVAPPGAPNAALSFSAASHDGSRRTVFTPFRFNGSYVVPLLRDEGRVPVSQADSSVRGATLTDGLDGVWLPIHQALGFPDDEARAAAEAAGRPFVALVRAVAVVPELKHSGGGALAIKRIRSQAALAVRLPPPEGVAAYEP